MNCQEAEISRVVDDLAELVSTERAPNTKLQGRKTLPKLSDMQNLDATTLLRDADDWFIFSDVTPELVWPLRVGAILRNENTGGWLLNYARTVDQREVRGKARLISPKMVYCIAAAIYPNGRVDCIPEYYSWYNHRWVDANHNGHIRSGGDEIMLPQPESTFSNNKVGSLLGVAFRHRYEWAVTISQPGGPSFRFATDPVGIKELFATRSKLGGKRKVALRNWISDHWRKSRHDPEVETYVRKHLRGSQNFLWCGYECKWTPAQADIEQNELLRKQRLEMGRTARKVAT